MNKRLSILSMLLLIFMTNMGQAYTSPYSDDYGDGDEEYDDYGYQSYQGYRSENDHEDESVQYVSEEDDDSYDVEPPPPRSRYREVERKVYGAKTAYTAANYTDRIPKLIKSLGERVILINPREHAWGAYTADGRLLRAGLATSGGSWCADVGRSCKTRAGSFRIFSLGNVDCISSKYPLSTGGGAPMPYCMFFNGNQGLHGSNDLREDNVSHGCVRIRIEDAEWLRFNFARIGTRVVVQPY